MYTAFKNASASFRSLNSNIRKDLTRFITNKKISRVIDDVSDQPCFQQDLDNLHQWSTGNAMQLSVKKCKVMSITKKRLPLVSNYSLVNFLLEKGKEFKDLRVKTTDNFSWNSHIDIIVLKANRMLE